VPRCRGQQWEDEKGSLNLFNPRSHPPAGASAATGRMKKAHLAPGLHNGRGRRPFPSRWKGLRPGPGGGLIAGGYFGTPAGAESGLLWDQYIHPEETATTGSWIMVAGALALAVGWFA
jgi:hypothetical protein